VFTENYNDALQYNTLHLHERTNKVPPRENRFSQVWRGVQMFKLGLQIVTNEITIVGTSLESVGPIKVDGRTGVTVTPVPPR